MRSGPAHTEGQQAVQDADPLAAALAAYLGALGFSFEPDGLSPWLLLVPVLFLELGSALGVVLVRSLSEGGHVRSMGAGVSGNGPPNVSGPSAVEPAEPAVRSEQTPDTPNPLETGLSGPQQTPKPDTESTPTVAQKRTRKRTPAKGASRTPPKGPSGPKGGHRRRRGPDSNVVDLLERNGGRVSGGQRGIAKSLGLSRSRTNEVLHDLSSRGVVNLSTGRTGTVVSLAVA